MRFLLIFCVAFVFVLGLLMVFNTSSAEILDLSLEKSTHQAIFRQIIYAFAGYLACAAVWYIGYRNLLRLSKPLFIVCTAMLILVYLPGVGRMVNGARRWIGVGPFTWQPSELIKLLIPLYMIHTLIEQRKNGEIPFKQFLLLMGVVALPVLLVLFEPDNGTTVVLGLTIVIVLLVTHVPLKFWALPMSVAMLLVSVVALQMPHVQDRIKVYLHPEYDLRGKGHQPFQAKIAAGSGELFGKGLGKSLQKWNYLPEAQSDYIAAIIAEEFGFVGMSILIAVYMVIAYCGFYIAFNAVDKAGFYLAAVLTFSLVAQALLNLAIVSGLLPSKGMNLPFVSQGGSSLIANMIAVALLLNIAYVSERKQRAERRG
ncbi:putative lipid II flippase FtsW [Simkania negevensis]|uniref:Probable peptidoglycan glycosyltransferase FtsW n=1 Tax=Simkania negevensis TaxID=83561 RepID=A0ABS3AQ74_9BACT|nr:putative lipid II flippase FtsW [Simkania negevensis]